MLFPQNLAGQQRRQKKQTLRNVSLILLLVFSAGCLGPKITVCVSDPAAQGFQCFDQRTSKSFFINYSESENFIAEPSRDFDLLLNYVKNNCH